jgi:hypothetical protein
LLTGATEDGLAVGSVLERGKETMLKLKEKPRIAQEV